MMPSSNVRQRFLQRLTEYNRHEVEVVGDENCQFRATAHQLGSSELHMDVREQLRENQASYEEVVTTDYIQYCDAMARDIEWGNHFTLQAASYMFGVVINVLCVVTSTNYMNLVQVRRQGEHGEDCR
ncbi:unnamed protein product [Arabis nemorensis]|uniref:OTU domain-containing protein n=1 Tax=Arabis nemorensis TaxID=586526 RepID=A0A565BQR5_9BRAS|nr:unnamed protein product [Arabis nemorensis]